MLRQIVTIAIFPAAILLSACGQKAPVAPPVDRQAEIEKIKSLESD